MQFGYIFDRLMPMPMPWLCNGHGSEHGSGTLTQPWHQHWHQHWHQPIKNILKLHILHFIQLFGSCSAVKWLVATSDQKDVNFKIIQSLLSTKSQSILAHNL